MDPLLDPPFSYYAVYNINHTVQLLSSWTPIRPSLLLLCCLQYKAHCSVIVLMDPLLDPPFSYYAVYNITHTVQLLSSWTPY